VQGTMLRAFVRLSNFWQPLTDPRAYRFRVVSNTWIGGLRGGTLPLDPFDEAPEFADRTDPTPAAEVSEALNRLVLPLPPRQRVIVLLADVFHFTVREIGAMIGATEGAVRAALHRGRSTLEQARGTGVEATSPDGTSSPETARVPARFVDAFNRHDAEAILSPPARGR
jgi:RNA polymerase sigma-70 factor (ECF subfamily)